MYCKNCGESIPDGARFCGKCGTEQDPLVGGFGGDGGSGDDVREPKLGGVRLKTIGIAVAVLAIIAVVIFAGSKLVGLISGFGSSTTDYLAWITEDEYAFVKKLKDGEEKIIIDKIRDNEDVYLYDGLACISPDGKTLYFINKFNEDSVSGTLYSVPLNKLKKDNSKNDSYITKIDSDVQTGSLLVQENGVLFYQTGDYGESELHYFNGEESNLLDKEISSVEQCGTDFVVYTTFDRDEYTTAIYMVSTSDLENAFRIATDADLVATQEDGYVLYTKYSDDSNPYYVGSYGQDSVKIASDVEYIYTSEFEENGVVFFSTENTQKLRLSDYLENPYAAEDAAMKEPAVENYEYEVTKTDWWGDTYVTTETDWDAYNQAYEKWERSQARLYCMEYFEQEENGLESYSTYYYKVGSESPTQVSNESMAALIFGNVESDMVFAIYYPTYNKQIEKISIDELLNETGWHDEESVKYALSKRMSLYASDEGKWLAYSINGNAEQLLNVDSLISEDPWVFDAKTYNGGKNIAILVGNIGECEVYTASITNGTIGTFSSISADDPAAIGVLDGNLFYLTGWDLQDLYRYENGEHELIAEEMALYNCMYYDDHTMLILEDYDYKYGGTLCEVDASGNKTEVDSDVTRYISCKDGTVLYVTDDTLKAFNGKESFSIAQDVNGIWTANFKDGENLENRFNYMYCPD